MGTPGALDVWQPPRRVVGSSWGDSALAKHRSTERALQSLPSLGHSGESSGAPGAPPLSPLPAPRGCGANSATVIGTHTAKGDAACMRGSPRPPLTTEYP